MVARAKLTPAPFLVIADLVSAIQPGKGRLAYGIEPRPRAGVIAVRGWIIATSAMMTGLGGRELNRTATLHG